MHKKPNPKTTVVRESKILGRHLLWLALLCFVPSATLWAEGFRNPPAGTFNLGRAGGRIAQVDDSSAVQQNPANLVDMTNAQVQLTPSVVYISATFDSSTAPGQSSQTKDPWKGLPNFFASMPMNDWSAIGLGVTVPYGLGNKWDDNTSAFAPYTGVLRYQAPYSSELQTININPTLSLKLNEKISIGIGVDAMWSNLKLQQYYPWFLFGGAADGHLKGEGDGVGFGANLALTWRITDHQRVAIAYRSPMDVSYSGNTTIDNIPAAGNQLGITSSSSFNTKIKFPTILSLGYGIELPHNIRVETDFEWIQFSRFKSLNLGLGNNQTLFTALGQSTSINEDWHDTVTAGIGADWQFSEHWILRAGYQYYESPVPNSTFSTTIPDADQNVFTLGLGFKSRHHSVEAAYGLDFYDTRTISNDQNPAFNGRYTFNVHLFSLAYSYTF